MTASRLTPSWIILTSWWVQLVYNKVCANRSNSKKNITSYTLSSSGFGVRQHHVGVSQPQCPLTHFETLKLSITWRPLSMCKIDLISYLQHRFGTYIDRNVQLLCNWTFDTDNLHICLFKVKTWPLWFYDWRWMLHIHLQLTVCIHCKVLWLWMHSIFYLSSIW